MKIPSNESCRFLQGPFPFLFLIGLINHLQYVMRFIIGCTPLLFHFSVVPGLQIGGVLGDVVGSSSSSSTLCR